jgi:hypothetical protein
MPEIQPCQWRVTRDAASGRVDPSCSADNAGLGPTPAPTRNGTHEDLLTAPLSGFAALTDVEIDRPGALKLPPVDAIRFGGVKRGRISAEVRQRDARMDQVMRAVAGQLSQRPGVTVVLEGIAGADRTAVLAGLLPHAYSARGSLLVGEVYNVLRVTRPDGTEQTVALVFKRERHVTTDRGGQVLLGGQVYDARPGLTLANLTPDTRALVGRGWDLPTEALVNDESASGREAALVATIVGALDAWVPAPPATQP